MAKKFSQGESITLNVYCVYSDPHQLLPKGVIFLPWVLHKTTQITDVQITNTVGTVTIQDVHVVVTGATHAEK